MGSSGNWESIIAPGQETNGDDLGIFFVDLLQNKGMLSVLIRIASTMRF